MDHGDGWNRLRSELKRLQKWMTPDKLVTGILLGALLLVIAIPSENQDKKTKKEQQETETANVTAAVYEDAAYVKELETRLKTALSQVSGVGKVEVMITLKSSGEDILEKDVPYERESSTETDGTSVKQQNSYSCQEETVLIESDGDTAPYVVSSVYPQVEGVLVVAQGGASPQIKTEIIESVQALFGVEAHKVKVLGMD